MTPAPPDALVTTIGPLVCRAGASTTRIVITLPDLAGGLVHYAGLSARRDLSSPYMEAAFFDLDKTIIAKSSPLALGRSFFKEGLIGRSVLLRSVYAQFVFHLMGADEDKMERLREEAAKLTAGWEQEKVRSVVSEVLEEVISPLIYAEALERIYDHQQAGRMVCIVSSSPEEIVEPLAAMLRVDHFIATRARVEEGKFTGELDFYAYGPHKATAMRALADDIGLELAGSYAYTDSITDLPMLEAVGHPTPVNPDKELRRVATERGWHVEYFKNPVSLRSRLPSFSPPELTPWSALAAAAGVAGIAILTWWVTRKSTSRTE